MIVSKLTYTASDKGGYMFFNIISIIRTIITIINQVIVLISLIKNIIRNKD